LKTLAYRLDQNDIKLRLVEDKLLTQPDSPRLNEWMLRLLRHREKLLLFNQKYWGRLHWKEWRVHGDRDSKFFHQRATTRRKKQMILRLKNDCGMWIDNLQDIATKLVSDYKARFTATNRGHDDLMEVKVPKVITDTDNMELMKLPEIDEVKQALFAIDSNKKSGPDGFGAGFFKHYWLIIKHDFYHCILEFFRHGKLLKQINHTFIALIPNIENAIQTQHFRPISLCNMIYKIISKLLVNRLRPLLHKIILPTQSAFVPGSAIHDNILITHEIMHKFKHTRGKTAWFTLKLDMKKAYDRLEWNFIEICMQRFGFHSKWIRWLMECIKTTSYSVLINGEPMVSSGPLAEFDKGTPCHHTFL